MDRGFVEGETAVARKQVQDSETAMMEELKDMTTATGKPETTFEEMLNAIGDSLNDLASSDDEQDREDKENDEVDTQLGKLSDNDEPGWVMGTISKMVQHHMESFRQYQMRLAKLMQPGCGDAIDYFHGGDMNSWTAELMVLAVMKPQTHPTAAIPLLTTF
jgi:hypothetical protein